MDTSAAKKVLSTADSNQGVKTEVRDTLSCIGTAHLDYNVQRPHPHFVFDSTHTLLGCQ